MTDPQESRSVRGIGYRQIRSPIVTRRRSPISPRTVVSALGQRSNSNEDFKENIEMKLFRFRQFPDCDPMENYYREVTIGEGGYTHDMDQDLSELAEIGFIIDNTDQGKLGFGFYGTVYRGVYGPGIKNVRDKEGNPLRNVEEGQAFAAKYVEFEEDYRRNRRAYFVGGTQEKRESYEIEKYVMTVCNHPNIVPIRMAINMGEAKVFQYRHIKSSFIQYDRVYLIMDFADLGSLADFMDKNATTLKPMDRIKMVRDLFWGLKYLHDQGILHGDIHFGNVLLFTENNELVAKWTDFGLADVTKKKEYVFRTKTSVENEGRKYRQRMRNDCERFSGVLHHIFRERKRDEESYAEQWLCDEHAKLVNYTKSAPNLDYILQTFGDILNSNESLI